MPVDLSYRQFQLLRRLAQFFQLLRHSPFRVQFGQEHQAAQAVPLPGGSKDEDFVEYGGGLGHSLRPGTEGLLSKEIRGGQAQNDSLEQCQEQDFSKGIFSNKEENPICGDEHFCSLKINLDFILEYVYET